MSQDSNQDPLSKPLESTTRKMPEWHKVIPANFEKHIMTWCGINFDYAFVDPTRPNLVVFAYRDLTKTGKQILDAINRQEKKETEIRNNIKKAMEEKHAN